MFSLDLFKINVYKFFFFFFKFCKFVGMTQIADLPHQEMESGRDRFGVPCTLHFLGALRWNGEVVGDLGRHFITYMTSEGFLTL